MVPTLPAQSEQVVPPGTLNSGSSVYCVQSILGQGAYGIVVKCVRIKDMTTVAVKMIKQRPCFLKLANIEVAALSRLKSLCVDKCNLVKWHRVFMDKGHVCLEFEHLDKSLYEFLKERDRCSLLLKEIRPIIQQLANALNHLKLAGIIHADLKLENVMLVSHEKEPYRVKVIDFGMACKDSEAKVGSYIQSRPYRAPEIILGLPFTVAIDMWSLGCLAAALYLGTQLYPGKTEYDMMRFIVETRGQPADHLLSHGRKTSRFFQRDNSSTPSLWKLKSPQQFYTETGIRPMKNKHFRVTRLDDLIHTQAVHCDNAADKVAQMSDALMFVDMLKEMLHLDATKRATPGQVLQHKYITMQHLISMIPHSNHVVSCFHIMDRFQDKKDARPSLQKNSPRSNIPVELTAMYRK
ncbi:homeodomain-interacting protein kinase 1-like [Cynoglossus semilaevis]|uniref:homeodomain-interacting protein kinase 1-like n=1 Tax=Cynoglossus semilaevis TaxID=244447 RepID=UPI000496FB9F|nr:homeodomain-interacting protein kinase 1-like [Cynoglossus semilaevis]